MVNVQENDSSGPNGSTDLGRRIRTVREAMGLSLRDLSDRCDVSAPMLSQVERDETSPTLAIADRIALGLGLSLSQLLRLGEGAPLTVIRKKDRQKGRGKSGHSFETVTPQAAGQRYIVSVHRLKKGASTGGADDPPIHGSGSRETLIVKRGSIALGIDEEEHVLSSGDSVTFEADLPHSIMNGGDGEAEFIAVVSAGLRQLQ